MSMRWQDKRESVCNWPFSSRSNYTDAIVEVGDDEQGNFVDPT